MYQSYTNHVPIKYRLNTNRTHMVRRPILKVNPYPQGLNLVKITQMKNKKYLYLNTDH